MATLQAFPFGVTTDGTPVTRYVLTDGAITVTILDLGGTIQSCVVPDRDGRPVDIALGYDTLAAYEAQDKYLGALVGRCANRIAGAAFSLGGHDYTLLANNGVNHLHGGHGFDKRVWHAAPCEDGLTLTLHSPDGDDGYPGTLDVTVTYALAHGALTIDYRAVSDADTLCNLTNHTYWNLAGQSSGAVLAQSVRLAATHFTPANAQSIPTGEIAPVEGTPMDLRVLTPIGRGIDADFEQLRFAGGYDHNWVIDGAAGTLRDAASAHSDETGISLAVETTLPGLQFYTGNFLEGCPIGKGGTIYGNRAGFCLETQFYPDAIHHANFPQPVLHAGETYHHTTVFRFSAD